MASELQYRDRASPILDQRFLEAKYTTSKSSTLNVFDNGIRYLQQTLLGFDVDNPSASLVHPGMDYFYAKRAEDERALLRALVLDLGLDYLRVIPKAKCHVNSLPVEILQEVFVYCLPDREWRLDKSPPPQLILSHICSRWRDIALCYPRLWSTFMIVFPVPRHIPMVKMWLERSGQYPLNLYIDHQRWEVEEYTMVVTDAVINLLRPHMHRWKIATFILAAGIQSSLLALPRDSYTLS
ncbi:hypothetical protein BT96DRAFT_356034 [Gymnopus androsaceus JB14]|uniref:Uncharacterized protein n=1 Tax=Gymnopus androsaceus JB14 TaxID=1447944 RepID=A0A6A4GW44_9AGAR|nr:hypothetical protein BT96DRAFT_356034 [Gymnopus androsaceus JB14]